MKEIFDEALIDQVFRWMAVIGPIAGLLGGLAWGKARGQMAQFAGLGFLIGLAGTFLAASWSGLNMLTSHYGPGRIKGYAIYTAIFMTAGLAYGTGVSYLYYRFTVGPDDGREARDQDPGEPPEA